MSSPVGSLHICDCGKAFISRFDLTAHMLKHSWETLQGNTVFDTLFKYICGHCGRRFTTETLMQNHISIHVYDKCKCIVCFFAKKHRCYVCGRLFFRSGGLMRHMQTHTEELNSKYICGHCDEEFTSEVVLKLHLCNHISEERIHTDKSDVSVDGCKTNIAVTECYKNIAVGDSDLHVDIALDNCLTGIAVDNCHTDIAVDNCHTGIAVDNCHTDIALDNCHTDIALDNCHGDIPVDNIYTDIAVEKCQTDTAVVDCYTDIAVDKCHTDIAVDECHANFPAVCDSLHTVSRSVKKQDLICEFCDEQFRDRSSLANHMLRHPSRICCSLCDEQFFLSSYLQSHLETQHGKKKRVCNVCGQTYSGVLQLNHKQIRKHGNSCIGSLGNMELNNGQQKRNFINNFFIARDHTYA